MMAAPGGSLVSASTPWLDGRKATCTLAASAARTSTDCAAGTYPFLLKASVCVPGARSLTTNGVLHAALAIPSTRTCAPGGEEVTFKLPAAAGSAVPVFSAGEDAFAAACSTGA